MKIWIILCLFLLALVHGTEGRCFCTSGLGYVTIDNYETKKDRQQDDIVLEFKSNQSSGLIFYARGLGKDFIYVGYKDSNVFMYHIDLGAGVLKANTTYLTLNDNKWHKLHLARFDRNVAFFIDAGLAIFVGQTPEGYNRLDIKSSKASVLGAPPNPNRQVSNFIGCIRDFVVDGHELVSDAWEGKPDYKIEGEGSIRLCTESDEQ